MVSYNDTFLQTNSSVHLCIVIGVNVIVPDSRLYIVLMFTYIICYDVCVKK